MLESQSKLVSNWREVKLITFIFVSSRLSGGACLLQFEEINVVILVCEVIKQILCDQGGMLKHVIDV